MTETLLTEPPREDLLFAEHAPRSVRTVDVLAGGRAALERANTEFGLALSRDEIDYLAAQFAALEAQSDRRRAHDVRAGELGALPPQDLQCRLDHRRQARAEEPVRDDPQHARALAGRRAVGVQGQCGRHRRRRSALVLARSGDGRVRLLARARAHRDQGRDAQPSDGHLAVPGRRDGLRRRDSRRGRDGTRRQAKSGARRLHGLAPRAAGLAPTVGALLAGQTRPHRVAARDHARGPDRRRELQQRVRAAELGGLFPHELARGRTAFGAATTSRS